MAIEFAHADTSLSKLGVVTSGSAGLKNATYTELISSTARASSIIKIDCRSGGNDKSLEVFIAVGAASSEVDQFSFQYWSNGTASGTFEIPFEIASGVRLSANALSPSGSATIRISVSLSDDDTYGTSSEATLIGSSGGIGTDLDPGGTINTKGSWTEISSSTPHDADMLVVCVGQSNNNNIFGDPDQLIDIALGAVSSEVLLVENLSHKMTGTEVGNTTHTITAPIPSGSRVIARCQSDDVTDTNDRISDLSILLVNITAPSGGGGVAQALAY